MKGALEEPRAWDDPSVFGDSRRQSPDVTSVEPDDERLAGLEARATTPAMQRAYLLLRRSKSHLARADAHIAAAERAIAPVRR
jgi:hypothetical protein